MANNDMWTIPTSALWIAGSDEKPKVGDSGYLISRYDANNNRTTWNLHDEPGRKNMSGEVCIYGWLGGFNNVSATAEGFVRVTHVGPRTIRVLEVPLVEHDGEQMSREEVLRELASDLAEARNAEVQARQTLADAVRAANAEGISKYRIQQITNLASATVDSWVSEERVG